MGDRKQSVTVLCSDIAKVERLVSGEAYGEFDCVVAGAALFLLYTRGRYSDFDMIRNVLVENAVIIITLVKTKTSGLVKDRLPLHILMPRSSIAGGHWFDSWMAVRTRCGIPLAGWPLIPARQGVSWTREPAVLGQANGAIRYVLSLAGCTNAHAVTSHSFKSTMLSVAGMAGISAQKRKVLGHHKSAKDRTLRTYSRDEQANPVEELSKVIEHIHCGRFDPDAQPGERWIKRLADLPECELSASAPEDASSESESSDTQDDDADGEDSLLQTTNYLTGRDVAFDGRLFKNQESGKLHRGQAGSLNKMACGKEIKEWYLRLAAGAESEAGSNYCDICFATRRPEVSRRLRRLYADDSCDAEHEL